MLINLFGGPGSGKSSVMAKVFFELKKKNINVEMAPEFAKDLLWEERFKTMENQIYIFGKQFHRIKRIYDKVDVVITDSPLLFSVVYKRDWLSDTFDRLVLEIHESFSNVNYFVNRISEYNPIGREQTAQEAAKVDNKMLALLQNNNIEYTIIQGNTNGAMQVVREVMG